MRLTRALNPFLLLFAASAVSACGGENQAVTPGEAPPALLGSAASAKGGLSAEKATPITLTPAHFAEGNAQVIEVPTTGSAEVAFRILFYTGSIDDPPGKEGLTALTAKLMAEGGTKRLSYPEILKALYPLAAHIDVSVDKEQTVFSGLVHPDHVSRFVPLLADVIREPRLPESDFARLRQDMINDIEKRLRATDDENLGKEMLNLMLYPPQHPYGHFDGGTVEALRSITLDDVKAHAPKVFGRRRMLLGIGGAIGPAVREALVSALASLPEGDGRVPSIPRVEKPSKTEVLIADKPGKAVAISIGYAHDARRGHPDFSTLGLVQSYFGEHRQFHGVLMSEMREKRGLNYGDYAYVEKFEQEGWSRNVLTNVARRQQHFEIWIRPVDPKDAVFAIRLAMFLLNRLVADGVPEKGVMDTRQFLEGYTRLWDLTPMRKVGYVLDEQFYGVTAYLDNYRKDLARLAATDVNAAIRRNLIASPLKIAIVAPDAAALKEKLVSGEKSAKSYDAKVDPGVLAMDEPVSVLPLNIAAENVRVVKVDDLFVR